MKTWNWFEKIWLLTFCAIAAALSFVWGDTFFGYSVFLTGVICVVLVAKGSIWTYVWGVYNVIGYSWLSYQNGFFGEVMLNAGYFLPMQLVGFLMWRKHMESEGPVHVRMQTSLQFIVCACLAMVLTMAYGKFLATLPGQNSPFLDAGSTVLSVIAMILMAMRYGDQWVYWIIINFVSITMWSLRFNSGVEGAAPMVVMWSAYLVNAVYGGLTWKRIYEEQKHDWSIPR